MKNGFLWGGSVGVPVHTLHPLGYWLHNSRGGEKACTAMCLLAVFWEEILCFWCMWGRIWSSHARLN